MYNKGFLVDSYNPKGKEIPILHKLPGVKICNTLMKWKIMAMARDFKRLTLFENIKIKKDLDLYVVNSRIWYVYGSEP